MRTPPSLLVVAALLGACGPSSEITSHDRELKPRLTTVNATPVRNGGVDSLGCKVEPPVTLRMTSRLLTAQRYELTVTATPTATVDALDVAFVLPAGATIDRSAADRPEREAFGATASGERRTVVAIVDTQERTSEISAIVRVPIEGIVMSKAATVTVGDPPPQPRTRQYATPDGELAREVRP